jgi:hypothetical protein
MSYGSAASGSVVGRVQPRIWTPPLRELTPETSYGFAVIDFARDVLRHPLDPWQEWIVVHAGELLEDGRPRFRRLLVLVARQNGKTELLVVLSLFWLFVERVGLILGTSTKLDYAAESWRKACRLARRVPELNEEIPKQGGIRKANGEQVLWRADAEEAELDDGSRYKIAASNEEGGRSLTIDRLILDELRQHHDYSAYDASVPATNAVPDAQVWGISNAGSDKSVVLNDLREAAVAFIETGQGDPRLGLFEYSAPDGASPLDLEALAQANPNLGLRIDPEALLGEAQTAMQKGGAKLAGFRTEVMCQRVKTIDPQPIPPEAWAARTDADSQIVGRPMFGVEVAWDRGSASISACGLNADGVPHVEVVEHRPGTDWVARRLRDLMADHAALAAGLDPGGPAGSLLPDLDDEGVEVVKLSLAQLKACTGAFHDAVVQAGLVHPEDELLELAVDTAVKRTVGDGWVLDRRRSGAALPALNACVIAHWLLAVEGSDHIPVH